MRLRCLLVSGFAVLSSLCAAGEAPLRICHDDIAHPPYLLPAGNGSAQVLAKMAAARLKLEVALYGVPAERCREELKQGKADAALGVAYLPGNRAIAAFPMRGDRPDPSAIVAELRVIAVRRSGSSADWNGREFTGRRQAILVQNGYRFITRRLGEMGVPFDDGAKSAAQNMRKLIAGRGDIVLAPDTDILDLLSADGNVGRAEALTMPFSVTEFYLAFGKDFYREHSSMAEGLWRAIAETRLSRAYRAAVTGIR